MKLQYLHLRDKNVHANKTVAVYQPNRFELEAIEKQLDTGFKPTLRIKLGMSKLHPDDKDWVKKIGRETALKNMEFKEFELDHICKEAGVTFYGFIYNNDCYTFKLSKDHVSAFLLAVQE